jgi:hypothetical protein
VLDGKAQASIIASDQIASGVGPGVKVGAAAQGLTEVTAGAFCHVVDKHKGEVMTTVDASQETKQTRYIGGAVLIQAVEAYQRIQEQQFGLECGQSLFQRALITFEVKTKSWCGDDVELQAF